MAVFSKVLSGGGGNYRLDLTVNQSSQSIPNNTSVVSWSLVIYKTAGSGYWSYNTASWNVNIGGQTRSGTISGYDFRNYTSLTLGSGSVTISHNADGTKSISNSGYFSGDIGSGTASGNLALSTIPRASSIGNISGNMIGSPVTVPINRASSSFTHTVKATFGSYSTTLTGQGTSAVFTPPLDWARAIPNGTSGTGTITLTTYNGSTQIGSSVSKNFTLNVPASVVPSFTTISHSEYVADVANKVGSYVQRVSRLNMAITGATGSYGSTISSYKITFAGQTLNAQSGVTQTIASNGTLTATGTITDSRGRTATKSVSIYVFAYDFPKISSVKFERCNSDGTVNAIGTYVKVTLSASVSSLTVSSVQKNSLKYTIQSKQRGTSSYTTKVSQQLTTISYSGNNIVATYSIDYAFDFNVLVNDIFNTTTSIGVISTGKVTMQWGEDWISVGKTHERGTGDFMGQIYQNDGVEVMNGNVGRLPAGDLNSPTYWSSVKDGVYYTDSSNIWTNSKGSWHIYQKITTTSGWGRVFNYAGGTLRVGNLAGSPIQFNWQTFWSNEVGLLESGRIRAQQSPIINGVANGINQITFNTTSHLKNPNGYITVANNGFYCNANGTVRVSFDITWRTTVSVGYLVASIRRNNEEFARTVEQTWANAYGSMHVEVTTQVASGQYFRFFLENQTAGTINIYHSTQAQIEYIAYD